VRSCSNADSDFGGSTSIVFGVSHDPDTIPAVRRGDGTSRNNNRPDGVAEGFQVSTHGIERHTNDSSNILANNPAGSNFVNNPLHMRPEVTVVARAFSLACHREWLTGEASGEDVNFTANVSGGVDVIPASWRFSQDSSLSSVTLPERGVGHSRNGFCAECSDVIVNRHSWKVMAQDGLRERLDLAEANRLNRARPARGQCKASNATKQV